MKSVHFSAEQSFECRVAVGCNEATPISFQTLILERRSRSWLAHLRWVGTKRHMCEIDSQTNTYNIKANVACHMSRACSYVCVCVDNDAI